MGWKPFNYKHLVYVVFTLILPANSIISGVTCFHVVHMISSECSFIFVTSSSGVRRRDGGIHRLRETEDDDDDNNTWNGNSTQQMWYERETLPSLPTHERTLMHVRNPDEESWTLCIICYLCVKAEVDHRPWAGHEPAVPSVLPDRTTTPMIYFWLTVAYWYRKSYSSNFQVAGLTISAKVTSLQSVATSPN